MEPSLFMGAAITIVVGILLFLMQRGVNHRDRRLDQIETEIDLLKEKLHQSQLMEKEIAGKLELCLQLLKRVEDKI